MKIALRLSVIAIAIVVTLVGLMSVYFGSAQADQLRAEAGMQWEPCAENPAVDCAILKVPVDWSAPQGPSLGLRVARRQAADVVGRIGVLFAAPGGPGGSAADVIVHDAKPYTFSDDIMARFDVISFDLRGLGRSSPVVCDSSLYLRAGEEMAQFTTDRDRRSFHQLRRANRELAKDCRKRSGPVMDHMDSSDVARDLDALRAALGEETITFYGESYGTLLGQMYAEQFPDRIRAMVMDGVVDHSLDARKFLLATAQGAQYGFERFVRWCIADTGCVLHDDNPRAVLARLYAKAAQRELTTPGQDPRTISLFELNGIIVRSLANAAWRSLAETLALLDHKAGPVPSPDSTVIGRPKATLTPPTTPHPQVMTCADFRSGLDTAAELRSVWRQMKRVAPDLWFNAIAWEQPQLRCIGWPGVTTNAQHRLHISAVAPVLILNARDDTSTPYAFAVSVADQISGSRLVTYDGSGHVVYDGQSDCSRDIVDRYLISLQLPANNTHCPAAVSH